MTLWRAGGAFHGDRRQGRRAPVDRPEDAPRGPYRIRPDPRDLRRSGTGAIRPPRRRTPSPSPELHACKLQESSTQWGSGPLGNRAQPIDSPRTAESRCYTRCGPIVGRSLVLNATQQPLAVVPARRAVVLVLKEKAVIVASNGILFRSERMEVPAPSVVRLRYFVRVPYRARAALTRRAVFARDGWTCQYCGRVAENVDHVIPKSRGGEHAWENVVAACRRCNSRKENRLPADVGLVLLRQPFVPKDGLRLSLGRLEPEWEAYL
jgi:5-methylcytosine-specific restriction endonuclease McrA